MGKVVKLDGSAKDRATSKRPVAKRAATQRTPVSRRPSRTALVLGGGGFTGGVYEIGALRALDLLSVRHTVNEFDVYVGTSAGSFVAAAVANGVTPEEMMRVIVQQVPTPFPDASISSLLKPNYREFLARGAKLPLRLAKLLHTLARDVGQISAVDIVLGLADALPTGLYSAEGIECYVHRILSDPARTDDFRELRRELYVTATDLDSCERVVFGAEGADEVPISKAVSASSALPMIYKPVRIGDREYIDGGLVSTTNLDIAVERGAKFIVVVNPLVPYVNDMRKRIPTLSGSRVTRVSDMGFPQIGYQAFKLIAHRRLHEVARRWEERYPGVDIVLIEPDPTDELMFQTSVLNFTSRVDIARHGFESVTLQLAHDYQRFKRIAARHGIEISASRVRKVVKHFEAERESTRAWRKILEQTTSTLLRQSAGQ
jgi:NTE family protein